MQAQVAMLAERAQAMTQDTAPAIPAASPASQLPSNVGSLGHPQLCRRPCILFARCDCQQEACSWCNGHHPARPASFDKVERDLVASMSEPMLLTMILPHLRRCVQVSPQLQRLVELVEREYALRGCSTLFVPERLRQLDKIFAKMTVTGLVGSIARNFCGCLHQLMKGCLEELRNELQ
ncbi:unnamed protein product [Effrenium voratum]|uniref:Uncharacterized protein n=1 Tax=Effrenium voratum TaxID=2562239 RepID=A0AA36J4L7_9DINO|nr:unnamed protein product [Effrenium voratum]CAJ1429386.1 unnamed protein product [Effrenium voratum]